MPFSLPVSSRLEGVFSLVLDEVVGVLLYQFAILRPPPGQLEGP